MGQARSEPTEGLTWNGVISGLEGGSSGAREAHDWRMKAELEDESWDAVFF